MIRNSVFAALLLSVIVFQAKGQTATLSPYSRFGPGELLFNGFAHQQAMGGSSIADFSVSRLNFTNPATYAYDTLMVFEFGLNGELSRLQQSSESSTRQNASLSYLSLGMPLKRDRWGLSFGIIPFSATGYDLESTRTLDSNGIYRSVFEGSGGYNRFYLGSGVKIGKHLSAGFNASYLFGTVSKTSRVEFASTEFFDTRYREELRISDLYYEFGLHWQQELKNNYQLAIGLTGSPAINVGSKSSVEWVNYNTGSSGIESVRDTVLSITDKKGTVTMPMYFGIGLGLSKGEKWTLLADATMQDWSSYKVSGRNDSLENSFRVSIGGRYTPDAKGVNYFKRISYRAGIYYHQTFLDLNATRLNEQGISLGVGLPLRKAYQSMLNFTIQGGQRGTLDNNLIREQFLRLHFGITFNEDWFRKRRYD
jgi:hypothetical protein